MHKEFWRDVRAHPLVMVCLIFLALLLLEILLLPLEHLPSPTYGNILNSLKPPMFFKGGSPRFPLGTDIEGRNILSRLLWGARTSLFIGFSVTASAAAIGVFTGLLAGWFRWADDLIMRIADIQLSFPTIMLAVALAAALNATSVFNVIVVLTVAGWVIYARLARGMVLSLKHAEYIEAARALGATQLRIVWRYVLPNLLAPVFALAAVQIGQVIIQEASLSYLGLGVPNAIPSWGGMLREGQTLIFEAWWPAVVPGVSLSFVVAAITIVGDFLATKVSVERPSLLVVTAHRPGRRVKRVERDVSAHS